MQGYIKLHRQILEWEWYKNIPVRVLFEHCLLRANHKDKKWQGHLIKKGSFITSYENLSIETGLTVRKVRTALDKLKMTGEVTHQTTSQYSIISINNWDEFQLDDKPNDKQMTNERQTNDKRVTTNNNDKNDKNDKNVFFISEKTKKIDSYTNSLNSYFCKQYQIVFGTNQTVFLSAQSRNKLSELAADYEDIRELIPQAIQKLKAIEFKDIDFTPSASWLLRGDNFERVMNGEFDKKKAEKTWQELLMEKAKERGMDECS